MALRWKIGDRRFGSNARVAERGGVGYVIIPQKDSSGLIKNYILLIYGAGLDGWPTEPPPSPLSSLRAARIAAEKFARRRTRPRG